jgi:hypothetical protein
MNEDILKLQVTKLKWLLEKVQKHGLEHQYDECKLAQEDEDCICGADRLNKLIQLALEK